MNLAGKKIIPLASTPGSQPPAHQGGEQGLFFGLMVRASGITRKELAHLFGWSKTYIDLLMNGEKNDPLEQARKLCAEFYRRGRGDLVPAILVYVAGGDDFDGRVLTPEQVQAIRELAKVVK